MSVAHVGPCRPHRIVAYIYIYCLGKRSGIQEKLAYLSRIPFLLSSWCLKITLSSPPWEAFFPLLPVMGPSLQLFKVYSVLLLSTLTHVKLLVFVSLQCSTYWLTICLHSSTLHPLSLLGNPRPY